MSSPPLLCLQALMCGQISGLPCLWWESEAFVCSFPPISPISLMSPLSLTDSLLPRPPPARTARAVCCHIDVAFFFFCANRSWNHRALCFTRPPLPRSSLSALEVLWIMRGGGCPALWLNPHSPFSPAPPPREARKEAGGKRKKGKWVFCSWHSTKTCTADEKHMIRSNALCGSCLTKR